MAGGYEPIDSPDETTVFPYHDLTPPSVSAVVRARKRIRDHLPRTPLVRSDSLSDALDAEVLLKREDTLPTGAFKVRGGVNLVAALDDQFRKAGLLAASTGNHGQSIAWAGREFDVPVTIGVPADANVGKVAALEQLGATVIQHGDDYDQAREHIEELAAERDARYVHSGNEPNLIAGVGTAGLEILDDRPDVDRVFCPIGGGSAAAGYCLTLGAMTDASIVGVQAAGAPAMYRAWNEETLEALDSVDTIAEGVATRVPFALPTAILQDGLADFRLVSEAAIKDAVARLFATDRIVMEGACATAVAAAIDAGEAIRGETVVIPVSGRNIDREKFERLLAESDY